MSWALVALTKNALKLSFKVKKYFPDSEIYTLSKWNEENAAAIEGNFTEFVGNIFGKHEIIIFIMATGIVVRSIAEFIKDKTMDPGIVVIDEKGKFVISLLSGHIGGANEAAEIIAKKIRAKSVITTASDVNGKIAVDTLAKKYGLIIDDMEKAKIITSMIVNGGKVLVKSDCKIEVPKYLRKVKNAEGFIYITNKIIEEEKPFVKLIPKNIILGIGCKKDTETEKLIEFIKKTFSELELDLKSIDTIASIDIKKDEKAILDAAEYFKCKTVFFDKNQILKVEKKFEQSEFVKETVGVGSVSGPSAYLAGNKKGKFLVGKNIFEGITLSVFERKTSHGAHEVHKD